MNFDEALRFLSQRVTFSPKKDKRRFLSLLELLGNPHERLHYIHIAGTNGKGSVTTMVAAILQAAGYRVGSYLSPYVFDVGERWLINGVPLSKEALARQVTQIAPFVEVMSAQDQAGITEFELKTAVAFCIFAELEVDYVVLEVGIGGRLDSTNVIAPPLVAAITSIGLDHMNLLGYTLREIATEKAGILKHGTLACVTPVTDPEALEAIRAKASAEGVPLVLVRGDELPPGIILGLRGPHQRVNASTATCIARILSIPEEAIRLGLVSASLPGRFQVCQGERLILDGAHNAQGTRVLADALRVEFPREKFTFVVGSKQAHAPGTFLEALLPLAQRIIATEPAFKPTPAQLVVEAAGDVPAEVMIPVADAIRHALTFPERVVVTGSFYVVGETPEELR